MLCISRTRTFAPGDKIAVLARYKNHQFVRLLGSLGPFVVRAAEAAEPDSRRHCQWLSIVKIEDEKKYAWVSHKNAWVEDTKEPPYKAVPPCFSNTLFKKFKD
jgi:hypothetical protein